VLKLIARRRRSENIGEFYNLLHYNGAMAFVMDRDGA
jgi:hypothetical protein